MSASHWITDKTQRALAAYLQAQEFPWVASTDIRYGISRPVQANEDLEREVHDVPCILCVCQQAEAVMLDSGEWKALATVKLQCSADDTDDATFHARAADLMNAIVSTTISEDLTDATEDYTAERVNTLGQAWSIEGRKWSAEVTMEIYCLGAYLPPA